MEDLLYFFFAACIVYTVFSFVVRLFRLSTTGTILSSDEDMRRRMPPVQTPFKPYKRRPGEDKHPRLIERGVDIYGNEWARYTCVIQPDKQPLHTYHGAMSVEKHLPDGTVVYHAEQYHEVGCGDFCKHSGVVDKKLGRRCW